MTLVTPPHLGMMHKVWRLDSMTLNSKSLKQIAVNQVDPKATTGALDISVGSKAMATLGEDEFQISDLGVTLGTELKGAPPYAVKMDVPIGKIEAKRAGAPLATIENLKVSVDVSGVTETLTEPVKADFGIGLGALQFAENGMEAEIGNLNLTVNTLVRSLTSADVMYTSHRYHSIQ